MTTVLYARVSTKLQSPEMQLEQLRAYAAQRGWPIQQEYVDIGQSGSKESRPELNKMMDQARKGKVQRVLVWKFDRFARSVKHLVTTLEEFDTRGIAFVSYSENLDTSTPMGKAMFAVIAAMAQLERDLIRERVTAGVRRAHARRGTWGRTRMAIQQVPDGLSLRDAAAHLAASGIKVSYETLRRQRKAGAE